ncbi:cupin domain-containing protein [Streptosporangium sp. NBC_01756]|uniref:cupin domain-containing protein n=1 Tax=Streptosporangium sp. NBC_01756 TaxID=2975950 RepID=UPI002DD8F01D|nr:cupin domain-containing protein [Streptosporangium sp. NBC_01756]WSC88982.1 cupin domain-containing protein [Streptosporangium sp. NBC_01756]
MTVIRHAESRRTETPNAVMTTLASPTQGGSGQAVWRVDMNPGQVGPLHAIDAEQVWTVLDGGATVELGGEKLTVEPGDTLVLPADVPRRLGADPVTGFAAIVVALPGMRAYVIDDTRVLEHCAVPDGDKLLPAWVV